MVRVCSSLGHTQYVTLPLTLEAAQERRFHGEIPASDGGVGSVFGRSKLIDSQVEGLVEHSKHYLFICILFYFFWLLQ